MAHRLYGYARDRHEITWNLWIKGFRISNFRWTKVLPRTLAMKIVAVIARPLNNVTVRRDSRIDGINKSVAGFVEPMKEKKWNDHSLEHESENNITK